MDTITINPSDVTWIGRQFLDPSCHTFYYDGTYYKAIHSNATDWLRESNASHFIAEMHEQGFIPKTEPCNLKIPGYIYIYKQTSEAYSPPLMWTSCESLKESALLYLNFNKYLLKKGLGLIDGHCNNTIFQGAHTPYWCDIGSIIPMSKNSVVGLEEFIRFHVYPLLLRQKSPHLAAISRFSTRKGMDHETAQALLKISRNITGSRDNILDSLIDLISEIKFDLLTTTWSNYYNDSAANIEIDKRSTGNARSKILSAILDTIKPKTIIDIGANAGVFSRYMAKSGAEVLAIEPDETAVITHHRVLRKQHFPYKIKLMVAGIGERVYVPEMPFYVAEMVTALALTHHLFFTMHYPWKYIVTLLASYTSKHLLTEFMPWGLSTQGKSEDLPDNYRIEAFIGHLERYFKSVQIIEYANIKTSPRIYIFCRDKRLHVIDDGMGNLSYDAPYIN